jgi:hypothetical protein
MTRHARGNIMPRLFGNVFGNALELSRAVDALAGIGGCGSTRTLSCDPLTDRSRGLSEERVHADGFDALS